MNFVLRRSLLCIGLFSCQCVWISFSRDELGEPPASPVKLSQLSVLVALNALSYEDDKEIYTEKTAPGMELSGPVRQAIEQIGFRSVHYMHDICDLAPTERTQLFGEETVPLFVFTRCRNISPDDAVLIIHRPNPLEIIDNEGGVLMIGDSATTSGMGLDRIGALILYVLTLGIIPAQQEESQLARANLELRTGNRKVRVEGLVGYRRHYTASWLSYLLLPALPFTDWKYRFSKTIFTKSSRTELDSIRETELQYRATMDAFRNLEEKLQQ